MRFKKIILIASIIISIILTSCTGSRELDNLGIVLTTGIDKVDGQIILTHEVVVPKSNVSDRGNDQPNIEYVQSSGDTVFDATRNASLFFDRKLFLAHNRNIILGEELAKEGIGQIINFYVADNEPRETVILLVAKGSNAYDVMGINGGLANSPSRYLSDLIGNYRVNLKTRDFTFHEFLRYFLQGENVVISIVEEIEALEVNKDVEKPSKTALDVAGGAVFRKDKLIGYFNGEEMKGFNFLVDEFENGLIVFETPDELVKVSIFTATRGEYTVLEVKSSKVKKNLEIKDEKLHLTIDVKVVGTLLENTKGLNISNKDMLEAIKSAASNQVKEYITMTMEKAQKEFKVDSFSIGNLVHIKYPHLWREISDEWESIFPDLDYDVNVSTDLIRHGLINTPVNIKLGEDRLKENK